jgi:hypothetical protein
VPLSVPPVPWAPADAEMRHHTTQAEIARELHRRIMVLT